MFAVFGTAVDKRGPAAIAPLAIGLTITMDVFMGGGLTGAAMNPSRWIGTAIAQGDFSDAWVYWVGPIGGALIAAFLYTYALLERPTASSQARNRQRRSAAQPPDRCFRYSYAALISFMRRSASSENSGPRSATRSG